MLLIDAYNLLHQWRGNPASDAPGDDLRALAALIRRSPMANGRVRLVCDGTAPRDGGHHTPGVEVVFAGAGQSADEVLIDAVNRSSSASALTVVSSDRMIAAAARKRGATVIDSGAFLSRLITSAAAAGIERFQPKPLPTLPLGDAEVGYWLGVFGETTPHPPRSIGAPNQPDPQRRSAAAPKARPHASASGRISAKPSDDPRPVPPALGPHDAWIDEARRMWPDLTLDDLRMDRWLSSAPSGAANRKETKR